MFSSFQGGGQTCRGGRGEQEAADVVSRAEQLRGEAAAIFFLFCNSFLRSPSDATGSELRE